MNLHDFLDGAYGEDGASELRSRIAGGEDINRLVAGESPLHVAARRRREEAVAILIDSGADVDATNLHGKTPYAHAIRRGFDEICDVLVQHDANTELRDADKLAVAMVAGDLGLASQIISDHPQCVRTGNPGEDRLLADLAGRNGTEPVAMLLAAGADLTTPGLDSGSPLHQAAWFGQPENARQLIDAGAPLDVFDSVHNSSPVGWAIHGARYSGGSHERIAAYVELVQLLLAAGASLHYPGDPNGQSYLDRLREDAPAKIKSMLPNA